MLLATGGLLGRCAAEVLLMMFPNHQRLTTVDFLRFRHFRRWLFNHINHRFKIWFNSCLIHFGYSKIFKDFILGAHNRHNLLVSQVPSPKSQLSGTLVGQLCHKDFLRLLPQLPCLHNGFRSVTQGRTFSFSKLSRNWIMWIWHNSTPVGFQNCATASHRFTDQMFIWHHTVEATDARKTRPWERRRKLHTALAQDQMVIQIDSHWFSDLSYITISSQNHHNHRGSRVRPYIRIWISCYVLLFLQNWWISSTVRSPGRNDEIWWDYIRCVSTPHAMLPLNLIAWPIHSSLSRPRKPCSSDSLSNQTDASRHWKLDCAARWGMIHHDPLGFPATSRPGSMKMCKHCEAGVRFVSDRRCQNSPQQGFIKVCWFTLTHSRDIKDT